MNAMVQMQSTSMALVPTTMSEAMRLAEFMSSASLIPQHLQGKPGDCLLVVMQAQRWGMDALSVAQCTSIVKGKLCYEGKLVSSVLMAMGAIQDELDYEFSGTGKQRKVVVIGKLANGNVKTVDGTVEQWETNNDQWKKDPDQMLTYRGARQWARRWAPSAMLGVYTPDEMDTSPTVITATVAGGAPSNDSQPDTGRAERTAYPSDQFAANLPKWSDVIKSGKKKPDALIAMIETKGTLTDEQKDAIRKLDPDYKPADPNIIDGEIVQ